jgi:hypothetical protein
VSTKYIPTLTVDKWPGWAFQPTPLRSGEASESESGNWVLERVGWPVHSGNDLIEGLLVNASIREAGVIRSHAVLVPSASTGMAGAAFLEKLRERGLRGVQFVVSDDHSGLRKAVREVLAQALWQRCYVHFLHNALDYLPRKADDDCLTELRWIYERRTGQEARQDLALCPRGGFAEPAAHNYNPIAYESSGPAGGETVLLIAGTGMQLTGWPPGFPSIWSGAVIES